MAESRITAPKNKLVIDEHLRFHKIKLDPSLQNHQLILFGEEGDNGMCADVRDIKRGYATMKSIGVAILITLLGNIVLIATRIL